MRRSARVRLASRRSAWNRFAPARLASVRSALRRSAPGKSAEKRSAPVRSASCKLAPASLTRIPAPKPCDLNPSGASRRSAPGHWVLGSRTQSPIWLGIGWTSGVPALAIGEPPSPVSPARLRLSGVTSSADAVSPPLSPQAATIAVTARTHRTIGKHRAPAPSRT